MNTNNLTPVSAEELNAMRAGSPVLSVKPGDSVPVNGVNMQVMNISAKSIRVRPASPLVYIVRGIPFKVHKMLGRDLVLRPMDSQVEIRRRA